jgi:hypothetical protein
MEKGRKAPKNPNVSVQNKQQLVIFRSSESGPDDAGLVHFARRPSRFAVFSSVVALSLLKRALR